MQTFSLTAAGRLYAEGGHAATPRIALRFVRHAATAANLAGVRCGGDMDPPLTDIGRLQAEGVALCIAQMAAQPGVIVTSRLQRTRETAAIIARALGNIPVVVDADWAERHLGEWNLRPHAEHQEALRARQTPPGGEPDAEFIERVRGAALRLPRLLPRRPLLVGSRGVARALGELTGLPERVDLDNGAMLEFDFAHLFNAHNPIADALETIA